MRQGYWLLFFLFIMGGCTSVGPVPDQSSGAPRSTGPAYPKPEAPPIEPVPGNVNSEQQGTRENLRLAQAQLSPVGGYPVNGTVNFEQMPNSVIITYHLDGVAPSSEYQLAVTQAPGCEPNVDGSGGVLLNLRTNKTTTTDHTFKTEDYSVSANQPLLGKWVSLSPRNAKKKLGPAVACGEVVPFIPPSTPTEGNGEEP
jgi:hypothetical protein